MHVVAAHERGDLEGILYAASRAFACRPVLIAEKEACAPGVVEEIADLGTKVEGGRSLLRVTPIGQCTTGENPPFVVVIMRLCGAPKLRVRHRRGDEGQ